MALFSGLRPPYCVVDAGLTPLLTVLLEWLFRPTATFIASNYLGSYIRYECSSCSQKLPTKVLVS